MIRNIELTDAKTITDIYNYYVENSVITFDEVLVDTNFFKDKIKSIQQSYPFLVYEVDAKVVGYAYLGSWKNRCAYKKTVEISVYIRPENTQKGIGTKFYTTLLNWLKENDFHTVIGGIALPNEKSVALHEKFGFKKVAHYKEIGYKFNKWIDVGYWQLILN